MVIYAFVSAGPWSLRALTSDARGSNLPPDHGPWRKAENKPVLLLAEAKDPIYKAIKGAGFLVLSSNYRGPVRRQVK
jgi:hypothetical protein